MQNDLVDIYKNAAQQLSAVTREVRSFENNGHPDVEDLAGWSLSLENIIITFKTIAGVQHERNSALMDPSAHLDKEYS